MPRKAAKKKKAKIKKSSAGPKPEFSEGTVVFVRQTAPKKPVHGKLKHQPEAEKWFVLSSGKEIKNIRELAHDLGDMEDFVFGHHVNEHRNDFVNWVKDVFEEMELAEKLSQHKDKKKMQVLVYEHIVDKLW